MQDTYQTTVGSHYKHDSIVHAFEEIGLNPDSEVVRPDGVKDYAIAYFYSLLGIGYAVDSAIKNLVANMDRVPNDEKKSKEAQASIKTKTAEIATQIA